MADDGRGVFLHEHHGHGAPHHQAAPDDRRALASAADAVVAQNLHAGGSRARGVAFPAARKHRGEAAAGNAVDVLCRSKQGFGSRLVEMARQRPEHEDAVHGGICVELADGLLELVLAAVCRQQHAAHAHPAGLGALEGAALIREVVVALTHAQYSQARLHTGRLQAQRLFQHLHVNARSNVPATQNLCHLNSSHAAKRHSPRRAA